MTFSPETFYFFRGRVALYALLKALGLKPGDRVMLQAFTCLAVPSPIVAMRLTPEYVDIDPENYNAKLDQVERAMAAGVKVAIIQHTFGIPAEMDRVMELAQRYGVPVIEDCCHSLGSSYAGKPLGSFGVADFYSYEWGKPLVIGVGGTTTVWSELLAAKVRALLPEFHQAPKREVAVIQAQYVAHKLLRRPALFWTIRSLYRAFSRAGVGVGTFRDEEFEGHDNDDFHRLMPESLRRRLVRQRAVAEAAVARRRRVGRIYEDGFQALGIKTLVYPRNSEPVLLRYPLLVNDKPAVLAEAQRAKVEIGDWFSTPIHPVPPSQWVKLGYAGGSCPNAEQISRQIITLPVHAGIDERQAAKTIEFVANMDRAGRIVQKTAKNASKAVV